MRGPNGGGLVVFAEESDTNVWRHVKLQMVGSAKIGRLSAKSRYVRWFELNPKRKDGKGKKTDDKILIHMVITWMNQ